MEHVDHFDAPKNPEQTSAWPKGMTRREMMIGSLIGMTSAALAGCFRKKEMRMKFPPRKPLTDQEIVDQRTDQVWLMTCEKFHQKGYDMLFTTTPGEIVLSERGKDRENYTYVLQVTKETLELSTYSDQVDTDVHVGSFTKISPLLDAVPDHVPSAQIESHRGTSLPSPAKESGQPDQNPED